MMIDNDSNTPNHQLPRPGEMAFSGSPGDRLPAYAILDNIRSVWNVGSIFRTADSVALGGLYLCGMTATPPRPDIEKIAAVVRHSIRFGRPHIRAIENHPLEAV